MILLDISDNFVGKKIKRLGFERKRLRRELFGEYRNPAGDPDYLKEVAEPRCFSTTSLFQ